MREDKIYEKLFEMGLELVSESKPIVNNPILGDTVFFTDKITRSGTVYIDTQRVRIEDSIIRKSIKNPCYYEVLNSFIIFDGTYDEFLEWK